MRTGLGYDLHRLVRGKRLMMGGVHIPFKKGEKAHSDGDVLLHAITDALLGAIKSGRTQIPQNFYQQYGK